MAFSRAEILARLRGKIDRRQPLVLGGAGIGLVAKVIDRVGIDIIMAYNTGPFRMDGHGSLAGYLAYGDANAITLDLAAKILPVVKDTPVIAGIGAADPYRTQEAMIAAVLAAGYSGVTNVPTAGIYDGNFRRQIDGTDLGYPREVELIAACRARDVFTIAYAFTPDEARAMAEAGADMIGAHVGLTVGGMIGSSHAVDLDEACAPDRGDAGRGARGAPGRHSRGAWRPVRGSCKRAGLLRQGGGPWVPRRLERRAPAGRDGADRDDRGVPEAQAFGRLTPPR